MRTTTRTKVIVTCTLTVVTAGLLVSGFLWLSRAKAKAEMLRASGRLSQMRLALELYERDYGTLPPLYLRDGQGVPSQSWRALILPYLGFEVSTQLNLSQPWNSAHNRRITDSVPPGGWVWFALDHPTTLPVSTRILAYVGRESIWDASTGNPKGKIADHPDAISLVWIPKGNLHPLQPGDITGEEIRKMVESGQEVVFIRAMGSSGWGIVTIERGELAFHAWHEVLDRSEGRH